MRESLSSHLSEIFRSDRRIQDLYQVLRTSCLRSSVRDVVEKKTRSGLDFDCYEAGSASMRSIIGRLTYQVVLKMNDARVFRKGQSPKSTGTSAIGWLEGEIPIDASAALKRSRSKGPRLLDLGLDSSDWVFDELPSWCGWAQVRRTVGICFLRWQASTAR